MSHEHLDTPKDGSSSTSGRTVRSNTEDSAAMFPWTPQHGKSITLILMNLRMAKTMVLLALRSEDEGVKDLTFHPRSEAPPFDLPYNAVTKGSI